LAALELRTLLLAIAERMPGVTLDGEVARLRSNFINGIKHMPVRLPPRQLAVVYRKHSSARPAIHPRQVPRTGYPTCSVMVSASAPSDEYRRGHRTLTSAIFVR
ncbi:MAG TPA: hypothetical protein VEL03_18570, partial [Streptosporangiaceae bacterium]|nr:hypothetical protein [Streptosporangiaceae bacterium]